jgi:predicted MFS family arabinose efflux permease
MLAVTAVLSRLLPPRRPDHRLGYGALIASMGALMANTPTLRRRALYQACLFGAFSVFWTATPLLLTGPRYGLSQGGVALFALVGAAGAVSAPLTGRWADQGLTRIGSALAMIAASAAFLISRLAPEHSLLGIGVLALAGVMLDFAVTANLVFGQRAIYVLGAETRSRMNGLYMATFFVGGAIASALAGWTYAQGGWAWTSWLGAGLPLLALLYFATEKGSRSPSA